MKWRTSGPKGSGDGEAYLTMAATKNTSTTRQSLALSIGGRKDSGRTRDGVIRSAYFLWEKNFPMEEGKGDNAAGSGK